MDIKKNVHRSIEAFDDRVKYSRFPVGGGARRKTAGGGTFVGSGKELSTFLILARITFCFVSTNQVPKLAAITHPVQINSNLPKLRFKDSGIWLREGPSMPVIIVIPFPLCKIN